MEDRVISREWWVDKDIKSLSLIQKIVHLAIQAEADKDGILMLNSGIIAGLVGCDRQTVCQSVSELADLKIVVTYQEGGDWFLWDPNHSKRQPSQGKLAPTRNMSLAPPPKEDVREWLKWKMGKDPKTSECKRLCPRAWGQVRQSAGIPEPDILAVWEVWRDKQSRPELCHLGPGAKGIITKALREAAKDSLTHLIKYAYESNDPGPRYWRGQNDSGRTYLGLDNLLQIGKLSSRLQAAAEWGDAPKTMLEDGTDYGPMDQFLARVGPRGTQSSPNPRPDRLNKQCRQMVELLLRRGHEGVTTSELASIALKYSARVSELRGHGYDVVMAERSKDGNNRYVIANLDKCLLAHPELDIVEFQEAN